MKDQAEEGDRGGVFTGSRTKLFQKKSKVSIPEGDDFITGRARHRESKKGKASVPVSAPQGRKGLKKINKMRGGGR